MPITTQDIQKLRQETGAGIIECKKALEESRGNLKKAIAILHKKGRELVAKKAEREAREGIIGSYIHSNSKIGALVEVGCETDFVAKNKEFISLAHDLAMQVAATDPKYLVPEQVPKKIIDGEIKACKVQFKDKPEKIVKKIAQGRIKKYCDEICLLKQPFIKDPDMTVEELIAEKVAKLGEKIEVKKFVRYEI